MNSLNAAGTGGRERTGIALAGNLLADNVKTLASYPETGMLADIESVTRAVGGCVPNTGISLAKMQGSIPLTALGRVGRDEAGDYVLNRLAAHGIRTDWIRRSEKAGTSFSDAICARDTGERTFFHYRGANAEFSPGDVSLDQLDCRMLHIGYLLLLDAFDGPDPEYGTVMARFLHDAQALGIQTSIDAVSDRQGRFPEIIRPALRWCDYAVMNEIEGCAVFALPPRDEQGRLIPKNIVAALEKFMESGVRERAIIHCPEAGFCLDRREGLRVSPSYRLPAGYIQGSVGAGDAFCAGCLYGIYRGWAADKTLDYAAGAAAVSLSAPDSVSGMRSEEEIWRMIKNWEKNAL